MAKRVQLRRGTTAQTNTFTGAVGEVTVDTDKEVLVVHDGITAGGFPTAARANADGTISLIKKDGTSAGVINATGLFNNTLTSTNTNQALTAAQGKILNDQFNDSSFGIGQTWQNLTASRVSGTNYTNSTGKPIQVMCGIFASGTNGVLTVIVAGVTIYSGTGSYAQFASFVVPNGQTYSITFSGIETKYWSELR